MSNDVQDKVGVSRREASGLAAFDYPVPAHANTLWYSLGGITLSSFNYRFYYRCYSNPVLQSHALMLLMAVSGLWLNLLSWDYFADSTTGV